MSVRELVLLIFGHSMYFNHCTDCKNKERKSKNS